MQLTRLFNNVHYRKQHHWQIDGAITALSKVTVTVDKHIYIRILEINIDKYHVTCK